MLKAPGFWVKGERKRDKTRANDSKKVLSEWDKDKGASSGRSGSKYYGII